MRGVSPFKSLNLPPGVYRGRPSAVSQGVVVWRGKVRCITLVSGEHSGDDGLLWGLGLGNHENRGLAEEEKNKECQTNMRGC